MNSLPEPPTAAGAWASRVRAMRSCAPSVLQMRGRVNYTFWASASGTANGTQGIAVSSSLDSHIRVWDLDKETELCAIDAGPVEAWTVALSADGTTIASGSQGGSINLWSVASGGRIQTLPTGTANFVMSVAHSPTGIHVACATADGNVFLFDVAKNRLKAKLDSHAATVRARLSRPTGRTWHRVPTTRGSSCMMYRTPRLLPCSRATVLGCLVWRFLQTARFSRRVGPTVRYAFGTSRAALMCRR